MASLVEVLSSSRNPPARAAGDLIHSMRFASDDTTRSNGQKVLFRNGGCQEQEPEVFLLTHMVILRQTVRRNSFLREAV
jgi:hypothetical protein